MNVFLTSPWIPAEWIRAHGLTSRPLWLEERLSNAPVALSAGVCAVAETTVRFAETHPADAVVFTSACDQMRRGYDEGKFRGQSRVFLFNLPATPTPAARQIYCDELRRLGRFLQEMGGAAPDTKSLWQEIRRAGEARRNLRAIAPSANARSLAEAVAAYHCDGTCSEISTCPSDDRISLALIGGAFPKSDWTLFKSVEQAGGRVTLNATKSGERSLCPEGVDAGDPFEALASGYFDHITDAFQRPNTRLYDWLKPRLPARGVRGLVLWHFTGCDLWRAEAQSLREAFGLPVLLLEAGEATGRSPRDQTRLQAFIEMLKAEG